MQHLLPFCLSTLELRQALINDVNVMTSGSMPALRIVSKVSKPFSNSPQLAQALISVLYTAVSASIPALRISWKTRYSLAHTPFQSALAPAAAAAMHCEHSISNSTLPE